VKGSLHDKYHLDSSSHFDRGPTTPACDGQTDGETDTHDDSKYRDSIASRGKNEILKCSVGLVLLIYYVCLNFVPLVIRSEYFYCVTEPMSIIMI